MKQIKSPRRWKDRLKSCLFLCMTLSAYADERPRLFIVGQDLGSLRDYFSSKCCIQPDGNTAYLSFYNLLSAEAGYGGLGIDLQGLPIEREFHWGAGPANAWKSAHEFGDMRLAIGLSITENDHPGALTDLANGGYDKNIKQLARFISKLDAPVFLRIGYEFDGAWNKGYEQPKLYIKAYRRVVDGLRAEKVSNVEFVWQGTAYPAIDLPMDQRPDISNWYPGDDYVDWIGFSLFLGLDEKPAVTYQNSSPTVRELTTAMLRFAREKSKPVMIAEAAPQGYDLARGTNANIARSWDGAQAGNKIILSPEEIWESWYQPVFDLLAANHDSIYAFAYINCNWDVQDMWDYPYQSGYWGDSRLQSSSYIASRFNQEIEKWRRSP